MHKSQEKILELARKQDISKLSFRELGKLIGEPHPQAVKHHLTQLTHKGLIDTEGAGEVLLELRKRVSAATTDFVDIEVLGNVNSGKRELFEKRDTKQFLKVSRDIVGYGSRLMALRVTGHQMDKSELVLAEGDYILVNIDSGLPRNKDYVVFMLDEGFYARRYYSEHRSGQVTLVCESSENHPPIYISKRDFSENLIAGKVVGVVRGY
ncbi:hypothetical protein JW962_03205 [Candidatus Dojkabacteria bacterium]|nr:hypothetical protein [Candidatus Dojkabacteria bacterium]